MMIFVTVSTIAIAIVSAADQGGIYAGAVAAGIAFLLGIVALLAAAFLMTWAVSQLGQMIGIVLIVVGILLVACRLVGLPLGGLSFLTQVVWLLNFQMIGWFLIVFRVGESRAPESENPFAEGQLPPQIMAPRDLPS